MIDRQSAKVLCECGRHYNIESPKTGLSLHTETVCVTKETDTHVQREPGKQYGVLTVRIPYWLAFQFAKWVWLRPSRGLIGR